MNRSRLLVFTVGLAVARTAAAAVPDTRDLDNRFGVPAVSLGTASGSTRIVLVKPKSSAAPWYAYERTGVFGTWRDTTVVGSNPSMVVVASALRLEPHAFYAKSGAGGAKAVAHVTRSSTGTWSQAVSPDQGKCSGCSPVGKEEQSRSRPDRGKCSGVLWNCEGSWARFQC